MIIDIEDNKARFLSICESISRDGVNALLNEFILKTDFFEAPASTRFHLSVPGGLCQHSLDVYDRLLKCYTAETWLQTAPTGDRLDSLKIVSLFHDLCKANIYVPDTKNQKTYDAEKVKAADPTCVRKDDKGEYVWETVNTYRFQDDLPMGHGEKSLYLLQKYGLRLTDEEAMAIRWHMLFSDTAFKGGEQAVGSAAEKYPLTALLHIADLSATFFDENEKAAVPLIH